MGEIIHSSVHMLDYLLFKKVEILLLVVKSFQVYRKLLRSDYSCAQFLNISPPDHLSFL